MWCRRWLLAVSVLAVGAAGCGKTESPDAAAPPSATSGLEQMATSTDPTSVAKLDGPAAAVYEFLDAVRTGNDKRATSLLSFKARAKAAEMKRGVCPPASDTARFQVGQVQYQADDRARVASAWTDMDENEEPQTDEAVWLVSREPEGWRITGVAATVFEGEPPLVLNFEDPEEMVQKQRWVHEEIRRRSQAELQAQAQNHAQNQENPEKSIRR